VFEKFGEVVGGGGAMGEEMEYMRFNFFGFALGSTNNFKWILFI